MRFGGTRAVATALAVAVTTVILCWALTQADARSGRMDTDGVKTISVGQVCESGDGSEFQFSCGTLAFGDLRYRCTQGVPGRCPNTRTVKVANVGRTAAKITVISGLGPGKRHETDGPTLQPGAQAVLRPRKGDVFLYDIVVQAVGGEHCAIEVVDLS